MPAANFFQFLKQSTQARMPSFEKNKLPEYDPVSDARDSSEDASEHDDLIYRARDAAARKSRVRGLVIRTSVFLLYTSLLVGATSWWWMKDRLHGPGVVRSPLRPYVKYEETWFPKMDTTHFMVAGPPDDSGEREAVWDELTQFFFSEFPREEMERLGRADEAIQLPNGNYLVLYTVNHLLHCLKRLHHSRYSEYYYPNITEDELQKMDKHDMHCLEDLVQQVMCHADTAPYTSRWYARDPRPTGNSDIAHECVNWDMLKGELRRRHVDPWEPGLLVHPILGPVVPDGKETEFPDRMSYPTDFRHVGESPEDVKPH